MPAHASSVTGLPRSSGEAAPLIVSASRATLPALSGSEAARSQSHATCPMASTSQHRSAAVSVMIRGSPPAVPRISR
eukprot:14598655-Alexandrium_andersonii.AAC.1